MFKLHRNTFFPKINPPVHSNRGTESIHTVDTQATGTYPSSKCAKTPGRTQRKVLESLKKFCANRETSRSNLNLECPQEEQRKQLDQQADEEASYGAVGRVEGQWMGLEQWAGVEGRVGLRRSSGWGCRLQWAWPRDSRWGWEQWAGPRPIWRGRAQLEQAHQRHPQDQEEPGEMEGASGTWRSLGKTRGCCRAETHLHPPHTSSRDTALGLKFQDPCWGLPQDPCFLVLCFSLMITADYFGWAFGVM